jgi:putative transposase
LRGPAYLIVAGHFPQEHWRKIWSTNPLERLNVAPRGALSGIAHQTPHQRGGLFPNDAAIVRLVGSQLQEQQEEWQLERRRFFSEVTMAKIPDPEEPLGFSENDPAEAVALASS